MIKVGRRERCSKWEELREIRKGRIIEREEIRDRDRKGE